MGWIPIAAGTAITAYSQYREGQTQAGAAEYNAQMARYESEYAREKAAKEEEQHRRDVARFVGEQTVRGAAAGGTTQGSDITTPLLDTLQQAEMDAALIRYGGSVESWRAESQADLFKQGAKEAKISSYLDPAGTILGAAGRYDFSKIGTTAQKKSLLWTSKYRWSPRRY